MDEFVSGWSSFIDQPFGAIGAICIMAAVTAINSQRLNDHLADRPVLSGVVFNCLNLVGGSFLFVNAVLRNEIVWVVLETYFVLIAFKGLAQLRAVGERSMEKEAMALTSQG